MIFLLAIVFGVWAGESSNKRKEEQELTDDSGTFTRFSSGYDSYRNVYWTLKQELKIEKEN